MSDIENTNEVTQSNEDNAAVTVENTDETLTEETAAKAAEVNESSAGEETKEKSAPKSTLFSYIIRIVCGLYLIYLSYQLITGGGEKYRTLSVISAVVFTVFALFIIILSIKNLVKGNFTTGRD